MTISDLQLARLEFKLNLIIEALQASGLMDKYLPGLSGIEEDACPVCNRMHKLELDYENEKQSLTCGCKLPKTITKGISQLTEVYDASTSKRNISESGTGEVPPNATQESLSDS